MSKKKYYWTTKDGKEIDVDELTPEHMRNIIKWYLKKEEEEEYEENYRLDWGDYET